MRRVPRPRRAGLVAAAALALAGCAGRAAPDPRVAEAIRRASAWLEARPVESPHEFVFLGVLHRRFGLPEFDGMLAGFDRTIGSLRTPDLLAARRILTSEQPVEEVDLERLASDINRIHAPALFCDRVERPRGYRKLLRASVDRGGYDLTHVALALIWMDALGCEPPFPDPGAFRAEVIDRVAALLVPEDGVTDLEIEAAAFLHTLGAGERVPPGFVDAFLAAQRADGSWPFHSRNSPDTPDWHATCLALWLLYELATPEAQKRPVIDR